MSQMLSKTESIPQRFVRDQIAWFCYLMGATSSFALAAMGPLMTFLRAELQLNYSVAAYHFSAWSVGALLAGLTGYRCMKQFGKRRTVLMSCAGLCCGIAVIACAHHPAATISGALLSGVSASTLSQTLYTVLADRFAHLRTIAITEANVTASLFAAFAPLAVGLLSQTPLGWRAALLLPPVCFCIFLFFSHDVLSTVAEPEAAGSLQAKERLPWAYWLCWTIIFLSVASEWSLIFWSADFTEKIAGLSRPEAAASVTSFMVAMVTGRILTSRLARIRKALLLLRAGSLVAILGFLIFWLNKTPLLCMLGLFVAGLGISMFYPLTLSMAIGCAEGLAGKATARMSLSSGGATLLAPLLLGLFAEHNGIFEAYRLVLFLLVFCSIIIFLPIWTDKKKPKNEQETD